VSQRKLNIQIQRKDPNLNLGPRRKNSLPDHKTEEIESHPHRWLFYLPSIYE